MIEHYVKSNGCRVFMAEHIPTEKKYQVTLVFLHGWGVDHKYFDHVIDSYLQEGYRCIIFDLPGFGKSQEPQGNWFAKDYSNCVIECLKTLSIDNISIIAHSNGARVATKMVIDNSIKINKLVFCGPAGIKSNATFKKNIFKTFSFLGKKLLNLPILRKCEKKCRKIIYRVAGVNDYNEASKVMKQVMLNLINEDFTPYYKIIKQPTLLIWGDRDRYTPISYLYVMQKEIQKSEIKVITGATHALIRTHADEFIRSSISFLN